MELPAMPFYCRCVPTYLLLAAAHVVAKLRWFRRQSLQREPAATEIRMVYNQGWNSPQLCAEAVVLVWRAERFEPGGRTVPACVETTEFADDAWISLPRGTPSERRDPRVCLEIMLFSK
jgi:hypothetical protein